MTLYEMYRKENPINPESSEFRDIIESEVKQALEFGYECGYAQVCVDDAPYSPID